MRWAWALLAELDRAEFAVDLLWVREGHGTEGRQRRHWQEFMRREAALIRATRFFCLRIHRAKAPKSPARRGRWVITKKAAFSRSTRFFCPRIHRTDAYRAFNKRKR